MLFFNELQGKEIIELYQDGFSKRHIAKKFQVRTTTINGFLFQSGIKSTNRQKSSDNVNQEIEIINLFQKNYNRYETCKTFNISEYRLDFILKKHKIQIKKGVDAVPKEIVDFIITSYQNGETISKINEQIQIGCEKIRKILIKNQIKIKTYSEYSIKVSENDEKIIIELFHGGLSVKSIAEKFKVGNLKIKQVLQKYNVKRQPYIIDTQTQEKIIQLYLSGVSIHKIEHQLNLKVGYTSKILKEKNIPIKCIYDPSYKKHILELKQNTFKDYINGIPIEDILNKCNKEPRFIHSCFLFLKKINLITEDEVIAYRKRQRSLRIKDGLIGGTENICSLCFDRWRRNAEARQIKWDISKQDIQDVYNQQNGLCYYSNIKIATSPITKEFKKLKGNPYLISLDRKDSSQNYTKDNIVLCCQMINLMKKDWPEDVFFKCLKEISQSFINKITPNLITL